MYIRILFLLCAFTYLIKADYSSEAKYIDLLPEDEKNEFLNRIARRIISEIRSRSNTQRTSVEISDERLNEHDDYVKKIIDEESQDMKHVRETEDDLKSERDGDADFVELKVKPLEKNDPRGEKTLENVDLSASENKIRIKKGTPETNTETSKENMDKAEDTLSTVPVHLLFDEEGNLQNTMNTTKTDNPEYIVNESLGQNNKIQVLQGNTEKKSNQQIDLKNESKDSESKDQLNKMSKIENSTNSKESENDSIFKAQTVIYDFEPKQDDVTEYKNDTTKKSSEIVRAKQFELDEASNKWIEIHSKNVTEDVTEQLDTSSVINNVREVTVNNGESTVATTSDFKTDSVTNHTSSDNVLNMSEFVLKLHNNSGGSNTQNEDTISSNKSVEYNANMTENYFQPATPANVYNTELESKDSTVASTITVHSGSNEGKSEGTNLFTKPKTLLRFNQEDINLNEQLRFNNHPHPSSPNDNRDMNSFQVFEVVHDKPSVQSKQINAGFDEAPYYVPVYNYAPNNAFYNPYNRFGPFNGNNPEVIETEDSYNKELSYEPNKFNSGPKYERVPLGTNNKKIKKDQSQRTFKHYPNDDEYEIDSKIPYQKFPVMKGKVINIHFNPNDYLDMDYYLGRSNDNPRQFKHDDKKEKSLQFSYPRDTSGEAIDPVSKKPHNMKNVISNIRMQMNLLKMGNRNRTMRSNKQKLKEKLKIVDKILANPVFRGFNNSLVVFIPKTRTKNIGTKDIRESNIAVDYYFSRMSSGEGPYLDDKVETEHELKMNDDELIELMTKQILKTDAKNTQTQTVIEELQHKIPLKIENVLKIDLAKKDNNVNELLQKVKKPKPNDFDVLLNAYLSVLKDMIEYDNKGLLKYDWLGSAVDVESALEKLITLSNIMHVRDDVHHYDRDLFRYVLFIFKTSLFSLVEAEEIKKEMKKANKRRSGMEKLFKSKMVPDIDILHQFAAWQEVRKYMREMRDLKIDVYDYLLKQFEVFLSDLRDNLNELHDAIKGIASVTKYSRQRWYLDLKELYLTPLDRKVSLTLLLHLASTRLFGLIEESAKNGLEEDFMLYVRTHKTEVERTREEFILVLRLLKELNRLKK